MSFTRRFTGKISHEAEIIFSGPMIDQSTFLHYPFSIFHQRTILLSARRLTSLRFPNLRPTAESAAQVVNLSLRFNYTGKYYRTDGVN